MKSLLVYCGSASGKKPIFAETARSLGKLMAEQNVRLIYGGGSVGLMGVLADSVLDHGGAVTGILPVFMDRKEIGHARVEDMRIVKSMHERKALMEELADAVLALPGGFGTFDELFEILTWAQLGLHAKPVGLLNLEHYYDHLEKQIETCIEHGFVREANKQLLYVDTDVAQLLKTLSEAKPERQHIWLERGQQ